MDCPDCGATWGKRELAASACQNCGELLLPDDLENLRDDLGISAASPPELVAPVIEAPSIEIPDHEDCPSCSAPLMENALVAWQSGSPCPYCGENSPHESRPSPPKPSTQPDDSVGGGTLLDTLPSETSVTGSGICLILNSGGNTGMMVEVPIGIIGRQEFLKAIRETSYDDALFRVSKEHFEISVSEGTVHIIDMGSTNGTFIDGVRIVGTQPSELAYGSVLTVSGLCFSLASREEGSFHITHHPSGVRLEYPHSHTDVIHLGRLTEDGHREPWYRMAGGVMEEQPDMDPESLEYISRRHLYLKNEPPHHIQARHEEGKGAWEYIPNVVESFLEDDTDPTSPVFRTFVSCSGFEFHKNKFRFDTI